MNVDYKKKYLKYKLKYIKAKKKRGGGGLGFGLRWTNYNIDDIEAVKKLVSSRFGALIDHYNLDKERKVLARGPYSLAGVATTPSDAAAFFAARDEKDEDIKKNNKLIETYKTEQGDAEMAFIVAENIMENLNLMDDTLDNIISNFALEEFLDNKHKIELLSYISPYTWVRDKYTTIKASQMIDIFNMIKETVTNFRLLLGLGIRDLKETKETKETSEKFYKEKLEQNVKETKEKLPFMATVLDDDISKKTREDIITKLNTIQNTLMNILNFYKEQKEEESKYELLTEILDKIEEIIDRMKNPSKILEG